MAKKGSERADQKKQSGVSAQTSKSEAAKDQLSHTKQVATDSAKTAKEALTSGASELASQTKETAEQTAETVGEAVDRVGESLRSAAASLQDGTIHERTFGQLAQGLADVSDAIREQDIQELSHGVRDFARRNPLLFAGAAALLGYSLSRMISGDRSRT